jgi:hypothetical protein
MNTTLPTDALYLRQLFPGIAEFPVYVNVGRFCSEFADLPQYIDVSVVNPQSEAVLVRSTQFRTCRNWKGTRLRQFVRV